MPEPGQKAVREPGALRTVLGDHPGTAPVTRGELSDPAVQLDVVEVSPVHRAFAPMVREEAYDLCELAVVTALQAFAHERPVVLLPAVVAARPQRACLIAAAERPVPAPEALRGARVGVRAYTQTTGLWVRTHLAEDHGVAPGEVHWVTRDAAHVEQYQDPPFVERGVDESGLLGMLRDGWLDAAVLGNDLPGGTEFVPVIPDAAARDRAYVEQHGFVPVNHLVVAGATACAQQPDAVRAAFDLLRRADAGTAWTGEGPRPTLFGVQALRAPLELVISACREQQLLPRPLAVDEVLAPARALLGDLAD